MPLTEPESRIAIGVWAVLWLPGLFIASWRAELNLRAGRPSRALIEPLLLLVAASLAYALYAISDARRYAQAHGTGVSLGAWLSVAKVGLPYVVSVAYLFFVRRPSKAHSNTHRWWVAALVGLAAVLLAGPGLLMTQLMVLVGN